MSREETVASMLDCVGLLCPVPIYMTAKQMAVVPVGACVEVLADDHVITQDMPSWCRLTGHRIIHHSVNDGVHRYIVRRAS